MVVLRCYLCTGHCLVRLCRTLWNNKFVHVVNIHVLNTYEYPLIFTMFI